jgi:hypothetical protein
MLLLISEFIFILSCEVFTPYLLRVHNTVIFTEGTKILDTVHRRKLKISNTAEVSYASEILWDFRMRW